MAAVEGPDGVRGRRDEAVDSLLTMASTLRDVLPIDILSEDDRREFVQDMKVRRFRADEVIYHQGDLAADAYVVFTGLAKEMLLNDDGHQALLGIRGRGAFFGELALFAEGERDSTVIAVIPTTTLQLTRVSAKRVLDRNPRVRDWVLQHLSQTIHQRSQQYRSLIFLDVPARLANYLLEIDHIGEDLPITQDDVAAAIGASRITVNKLLADFDRRKLVEVERRKVTILDRDGLAREARR
jgi:CRP-like cAMP-binding protein